MVIRAQQLKMNELDKSIFESILKKFYKSYLYNKEDYDEFVNELNNLNNTKSLDKSNIIKISKYIYEIIERAEPNFPSLLLEKASEVIACAYLTNNKIFEMSFEGGMNNFTNYIETFIASNTTNNSKEVLLYKEELYSIIKKMEENRHFIHNPPDQILEQ